MSISNYTENFENENSFPIPEWLAPNQKLVDKFNIFAGQQRNWLLPSYGKTKYEDMTTGE